jgi:hypothetical protein
MELYRELGEKRGVAICLNNLGYADQCEGKLSGARALYEQALGIFREVQDPEYVALALADVGRISTRLGEPETARGQILEGLRSVRDLGVRNEAAYLLEASAELGLAVHDPRLAATLLGAAEALRESIQSSVAPPERREQEALWSRIQAELGEGETVAALSEGRSWSVTHALDEALSGLRRPSPEPNRT